MKTLLKSTLLATMIAGSTIASAATYVIDDSKAGAHSQIDVKVSHLGFSWVKGRFNNFEGTFEYDKSNINDSSINVTINTTSFDSNQAKRDKHVMSADFLDAGKYPTATFKSSDIKGLGDDKVSVTGDLTLHGVTKAITFDATLIGEGKTPWGDYRAGFEGSVDLKFADFNIDGSQIGTEDFTVNMFFEGVNKD
ncbi:YceI family protein [Marinomonas sp. 15G1-11]|uniref:YceI family protein n=1 Tax=Marinomonas phaeophyticola TaxID=3004091 RepID=A0ABT4JXN7_9GAMM|nr:YceI family protein [Marinomonas sp. 15G1-11]MCZ2723158.1 YceI family protein [Marinomonas sp. 15G1-11]